MPNPWQRFVAWLNLPGNRRRLTLGVISVVAVIAAVLFFSQLDFLLRLFGIRAAVNQGGLPDNLNWQSAPSMGTARSNHSLVQTAVKQSDGTIQYQLWALGGANIASGTIDLLRSTERLMLDNTGQPASSQIWQAGPAMKYGHAAGRAVAVDYDGDGYHDYLYMVAGNMNLFPEIVINNPELPQPERGAYSTIERLNLHNISAGWEIFASLTDVHYLPEVAVTNLGGGSQNVTVNVIGGIFGNIWQRDDGTVILPPALTNPPATEWVDSGASTKPIIGTHPPYILSGNQLGKTAVEWDGRLYFDTDGDGLPDWYEILIGTNPNNPDTDGDGALDGVDSAPLDPLIGAIIVKPDTGTDETTEPDTGVVAPDTGVVTTSFSGKLLNGWQRLIRPAQAQIIPTIDYGKLYALALRQGRFMTTVETRIRFMVYPDGRESDWWVDEFANDAEWVGGNPQYMYPYETQFWNPAKVMKLGFLRLYIHQDQLIPGGPVDTQVRPVPQGRYGHQVAVRDDDIWVFGGASVARYPIGTANSSQQKFWVLDDIAHPDIIQPVAAYRYQLIGHTTLRSTALTQDAWFATNYKGPHGRNLSSQYAPLVDSLTGQRGGLFAPTLIAGEWPNWQLAGGVINPSTSNSGQLRVTNLSQRLDETLGWVIAESDGLASTTDFYENITEDNRRFGASSAVTKQLNAETDRAVVAGGYMSGGILRMSTTSFFYPTYNLQPAPRFSRVFGLRVDENNILKRVAQWMWSFHEYAGGNTRFKSMDTNDIVMPATAAVRIGRYSSDGALVGEALVMYLTGGSSRGALPNNVQTVEYIGPLYSGLIGVPNTAIVSADKTSAYADGEDAVIITAQILDAENQPVAGAKTWLSTSRGGDTLTAEAPYQKVDERFDNFYSGIAMLSDTDGYVKARLTSLTAAGYLAVNASVELEDVSLAGGFVALRLSPRLTSVDPALGIQGNTETLTINNVGLSLPASPTPLVRLTRAQGLRAVTPIVSVVANGSQNTAALTVTLFNANGQPHVGQVVSFARISPPPPTPLAGGTLSGGTATTDATGQATITYRAGNIPGVVYITASAPNVNPVTIVVIETDPVLKFYDLTLSAAGGPTLEPGVANRVTANLKSGNQPQVGQSINFIITDTSTINPVIATTDSGGNAESTLTRQLADTSEGHASFVAYGTLPNGRFIAAAMQFVKPAAGSSQITITNISRINSNSLSAVVEIGEAAPVGFWNLSVYQRITNYPYAWWMELPGDQDFEVLSGGGGLNPYITINPTSAVRGTTFSLTATGYNTNFIQPEYDSDGKPTRGSILVFEYGANDTNLEGVGNRQGITISNISVNQSAQTLTATVTIAANTTPGWWEVRVDTIVGNDREVAQVLGPQDFLVKVSNNGYLLDLQSDKYALPADNQSTAALTMITGWFNNNDGRFERRDNRPITLTLAPETAGSILPSASGNTNSQGVLTRTYRVNDQTGGVQITAATTIDSNNLTAVITIQRTADHNFVFRVLASPVQINVDGFSTITVELRDRDDASRTFDDQRVTLRISAGTGRLIVTSLIINNNVATTTFLAEVPAGTTRIEADATVIGTGPISTEPLGTGVTITKTATPENLLTLNIVAPVEGSVYDYLTADRIRVIIIGKQETSSVLDGLFKLNSNNQIIGLPQVAVSPSKVYDIWVKAAQHLAVAGSFVGNSVSPVSITLSEAKIGDINANERNNFIDSNDFSVFTGQYRQSGLALPIFGDFNGDGSVDANDFAYLFKNWFQSGSPRPGS